MDCGIGAVDEGPEALVFILPEAGEEVRVLSGDEGGPIGGGEEVVVAALDGEHGAEDGSVTGAPGDMGAKDIFPDEDAGAVYPGGMEFTGVVGVPAVDEVELVAGFEPFIAEDARCMGIGEPLGPGEVVCGDVFYGQGEFTFEDGAGFGGLELAGEAGVPVGHGIEEDAVGIESLEHEGQGFGVGAGFALGSGIPGVVIDEDAGIGVVALADEFTEAEDAAGHIAIEVELVTGVGADAGVGVPEDDGIVAAEVFPGGF